MVIVWAVSGREGTPKNMPDQLLYNLEEGQVVFIGGDITITVIEIAPGRCRFGISAPKNISINRLEIQRLIDQEKARRQRADGGSSCV